jgi:REP element-mobilizing transposase RayT
MLEAVEHYHVHNRWFARLFLIMPDHVHALLAFSSKERMTGAVGDWKRYTNRACAVEWQREFFDHRIRNDESWELKAAYIRENPVRKGVVSRVEHWPWVFEGRG